MKCFSLYSLLSGIFNFLHRKTKLKKKEKDYLLLFFICFCKFILSPQRVRFINI